jgi:hypothetical protein
MGAGESHQARRQSSRNCCDRQDQLFHASLAGSERRLVCEDYPMMSVGRRTPLMLSLSQRQPSPSLPIINCRRAKVAEARGVRQKANCREIAETGKSVADIDSGALAPPALVSTTRDLEPAAPLRLNGRALAGTPELGFEERHYALRTVAAAIKARG